MGFLRGERHGPRGAAPRLFPGRARTGDGGDPRIEERRGVARARSGMARGDLA